MKRKILFIIFAVMILACALPEIEEPAYAASFDGNLAKSLRYDWMKYIDGDKTLAQFTIPGTHDSGSKECTVGSCHDVDIDWQLKNGVRFLDIRLKLEDGDFRVHHGVMDANLTFNQVLQWSKDFLRSHPSECIIMSIKNEGDTEVDGKYFHTELENNFIKSSSWSSLFYTGTSIPKLDDVRGKIVLFRRYGSSSLGINASSG